jgi:FtsH-binding integral membrane protein
MHENNPFIVDVAPVEERVSFYRRTYLHVAGALLGFAALLAFFFAGFDQSTGIAFTLASSLFGLMNSLGSWSWLLVMVAFWGGTMVAQSLASNRASVAAQYSGLGLYVLLQALMFIPLLVIVHVSTGGQMAQILVPACTLTGALVVGLTLSVFMTNADFSFLRTVIVIGSVVALAVVLLSFFVPLVLGTWFALAMILLMATAILYQTWVIKTQLTTGDYIIAAFMLFSSIVTLLWYVISFFLGRRSD